MTSPRRTPCDLSTLVAEIKACRLCVEVPQGRPLPHQPRPVLRVSETARIAIAGQAPGTRVHRSGLPFTDPSGDRLRDWMGVTAPEFYDAAAIAIVPMGFCFPGLDAKGGDLPPRRECAAHWRHRLMGALPRLELLLAIGQYAHRWHLGPEATRAGVTETVRRSSGASWSAPPPVVVALPHPSWRNNAWLKANPWFEPDVLVPMRKRIRAVLGERPKAMDVQPAGG